MMAGGIPDSDMTVRYATSRVSEMQRGRVALTRGAELQEDLPAPPFGSLELAK